MQTHTTYEKAIETKFPEQVVIAIVKDAKGKYNPVTVGWAMIASHEPPMMAIALARGRYSTEAVRQARQFVISFPSATMAREAMFFGTRSGSESDKMAECGTLIQPAEVIDGVILSDAVANFECKLETELAAGDHIIFVGQVVAAHINEDPALRRLYTLGNGQMGSVRGE